MKNKDENIKQFLSGQKLKFEDAGFSRKVISRLPERKSYDWVIGLFAFLGSLTAGLVGYYSKSISVVLEIPSFNLNQILIFSGILALFPLGVLCYFMCTNQRSIPRL